MTEAGLARRFQFKQPVIRDDGQGGDDEADDGGDDMEGDADLANEVHADQSGDDIDEDLDFGGGGPTLALPPELNDIVQIQCSRPDRKTGAPAGANGVEMFINLPPAMMERVRRPEAIERLAGARGIR